MKRLRVKTGVVVPSRPSVTGFVVGGMEFKPSQPPLLDPIRCTATPPCGHCWYCNQATKVAQ